MTTSRPEGAKGSAQAKLRAEAWHIYHCRCHSEHLDPDCRQYRERIANYLAEYAREQVTAEQTLRRIHDACRESAEKECDDLRSQVEHLQKQHAIGLADLREELRLSFENCRAFEASEAVAWRELTGLRAQLQTLRGERDKHEHCIAEIQADMLKVAERENELHAEKDAQIARLTQEKAALEAALAGIRNVSDDKTRIIEALEARERARPDVAVREFHEAFNVAIGKSWVDPGRRSLRRNLIAEEFKEYCDAEAAHDPVETLDALVDMVYVIVGAALEYGFDFAGAFAAVHAANMAKLGPDGKPIVRADGKVLKPEGWKPADLTPFTRSALAPRRG